MDNDRLRPFSQVVQETVSHLAEILRSEFRLAHAEVRQDLAQLTRASTVLVIGAILGLYALGFVLLGIVYALATSMAPWLAAGVVGGVVGVLATILLIVGRSKLKQADLKPDQTIRSMQENITWMKKQVR